MSTFDWLLAPLVCGLLVLISHVALGRQVLQRGIVFIDLAVAQLAGLGVLLAAGRFAADWANSLAGSALALLGAGGVAWLSQCWPARREALIGLVYIGAAALAVLLLAADPHGHQRLSGLLAGDVLWVSWSAMLPLAVLSSLFLLCLAWRPQRLAQASFFYTSFALLVSQSVALLGVYLVFASLIVPALAWRRPGWRGFCPAFLLGAAGYLAGLLLSWWQDWPSGACIVLSLITLAVLAWLPARQAATF